MLLLTSANAVTAVRDRLAHALGSFDTVRDRLARNVSELSVSYHSSPIVETHTSTLAAISVVGSVECLSCHAATVP